MCFSAEDSTKVIHDESALRTFLIFNKHRHLFTLGCLILALTVATDPFIQQAIIIKERLVPADGLSSIKICDASLYNDSIPGPGPGLNKVSLVTLGALYSGLFQNRGSQDMTAGMECSTGNCTFDTYQSLEICSSCTDITDLLDHSTKNHPLTTGREDIYKLSNGISLSTFQGEPVIMNASSYMGLLRLNVGTAAIITNLTAISLPIESAFSDNPQAHATECTFFFCIKAYDTVVQEAQLSENQIQVSTSSNTTASVEYVLQNFVLTPDTCYFNNTRIQDPHDNYENCVYKVDPFSRLALGNSISPLLNGTAISMNTYRQIWSDNLEALYGTAGNFSQIESTVKSIARALSINARTSICNSKVKGTAWTNQSFVHVRWQWLALPAALMAMGLSFLAFTVVKTRTQYIWKSSPLALLFLHLSNEPSPFPESDPTLNTMEQNANDSRVCLETSSEGIIFRPTSKSE